MTDVLVECWESEIQERIDEAVNDTLTDIVAELTTLRDGMYGSQYYKERLTLNTAMQRIELHKRGNGRNV